MATSLSIEETNRLRETLGLKPLPVPGDAPEVSEDLANWEAHQNDAKRKEERQRRSEDIKKARDKAKRFEKLAGKGLADDDEPELDSKAWLLGQKQRQKKLEKRRERERRVEAEQRQREEQEYTAKDLAGVKVGHEVEDFDLEGGEQILTLKDATIDENEEEGDELENVDLRDKERLKDRLDLKKKKPVYDPNAMDEDDGSVLQQYDEVIDGKKRKRFTLDIEGSALDERDSKRAAGDSANRQQLSLDLLKEVPVSDYQEPKEAKFKKPKKTKKKATRQRNHDDEDDLQQASNGPDDVDTMNVDTDEPSRPAMSHAAIIDDDDLQSSLARQRREVLKKRKKTTASELAQKLREEEASPDAGFRGEDDEPGLVLNETSEFVETLKPADIEEERRKAAAKAAKEASPESSDDEDVDMEDHALVKEESPPANGTTNELTETGLDHDINMGKGIGSALSLLRQRGLVEKTDSDDPAERFRGRQKFLSDKRRHEEAAEFKARQQRERDRTSGKLDRMSIKEREEYARWENKHRDQQESRQLGEIFSKEYKPSFDLNYVDEHGRHMNKKEAFKHLSHKFHGKGSGKQKTEKKLKKIEEEKGRAAQSVLGSGQTTGLNSALGSTTKKTKQAGVRLA